MKVLVVGPYASPIVKRLCYHLEGTGYEVIIASHNVQEVQGKVINLGQLNSFFDYFNFLKIIRLVRLIKPDVVHAHILNHYGLMCLLQNKPLVVALWGSDVLRAPVNGNFLSRTIFRCINYLVLRRANGIHTSSAHVALEANKQFKGSLSKAEVFYWGFPLQEPNKKRKVEVDEKLANEFSLNETGSYIVFPRGLAKIYNPEAVAKIIQILLNIGIKHKIVVLKGFCGEDAVRTFRGMIDLTKIIFVDRLLSDEELYCLYKRTDVHFSIPISDSLGGGVVEPALLGSYPILSNLPPYLEYIKNNPGYIIENYSDNEIHKIAHCILDGKYKNSTANAPESEYGLDSVMSGFKKTYTQAKQ